MWTPTVINDVLRVLSIYTVYLYVTSDARTAARSESIADERHAKYPWCYWPERSIRNRRARLNVPRRVSPSISNTLTATLVPYFICWFKCIINYIKYNSIILYEKSTTVAMLLFLLNAANDNSVPNAVFISTCNLTCDLIIFIFYRESQ